MAASGRAALLANPSTRSYSIGVTATGGTIELTGRVATETERQAAEAVVARIPGVATVRNVLFVHAGAVDDLSHGQFRHGEERSWGGYGGGGYERERRAEEPRERNRP